MDADRVATLLRQVAIAELIPRSRALHELAVHDKPSVEDPDDIVTEADLAVERVLEAELPAMVPGSVVIGEEATARNGAVRDAIDHAPHAWLVDPLDGTKNFAAGRPQWGTMVTLCERGDAVACWIYHPLTDEMLVAERGSGAFLNGERLVAREPAGDGPLAGTTYTRFMTPELRAGVEARVAASGVRLVPGAWSAAHDYAALARGTKDFVLYWRLLPWDHAPGALLLAETGGAVRHGDGRPYRAADRDPLAISVRHAALWERARAAVLG